MRSVRREHVYERSAFSSQSVFSLAVGICIGMSIMQFRGLLAPMNQTFLGLSQVNLAILESTLNSPANSPATHTTQTTGSSGSDVGNGHAASTTSSTSTIVNAGPKTIEWPDWPAIAYEEVGHALVTKGDSVFHHARDFYFESETKTANDNTLANANANTPTTSMTPLMKEFLQIYKNRPDPVNLCGIRINHALALFLAVKQIQPTLVVESGVNAGISTYFIRSASPTTRIFAIDPEEKPICDQGDRWIDSKENIESNKTINYTGGQFVDLMALDWAGMIFRNEVDPSKTLVFLDDHLHTFDRMVDVMKHGLRYILVEDNYKLFEGATPKDRVSTPKQYFKGTKYKTKGEWLFQNTIAYAEFPPLVPPIVAKANSIPRKPAGGFMVANDTNTDIVPPMLRPELFEEDKEIYHSIAKELDLDPSLTDLKDYMQFMNYNNICLFEVLAVPK